MECRVQLVSIKSLDEAALCVHCVLVLCGFYKSLRLMVMYEEHY